LPKPHDEEQHQNGQWEQGGFQTISSRHKELKTNRRFDNGISFGELMDERNTSHQFKIRPAEVRSDLGCAWVPKTPPSGPSSGQAYPVLDGLGTGRAVILDFSA